MASKNTLVEEHFKEQSEYLLKRGITPKQATNLKVEICGETMLQNRGITWPGAQRGILWHVWDAQGIDTGNVGARLWYKQNQYTKTEGEKPKFVSPGGQVPRIYHSPLAWPNDLQKNDTLVLCESYLKADIAALCGFKSLGISGVWGWSHNKQIIDDFMQYPYAEQNLTVLICFDSNVRENGGTLLNVAVERLAAYLERYEAEVKIAYLPPPNKKEDWGLDDYYQKHGKAKVVELLTENLQPVYSSLTQHMHVLNDEVAVVRELSKIVDIQRGVFYTRDAFCNIAYADRKVWADDGKPYPVAKAWLEWPQRTAVENVVYKPGQPRLLEQSYNLWQGMGCEPLNDDELVDLFIDWVERVLPNDDECEWFICWWAYQLQHLGVKMATALVLVGVSGVGKGWLASIVKGIYGAANYAPSSLGDLGSRFNADYSNKQIMVIEEAKMPRGADSDVIYNKLKDVITNPTLRMERKGMDAIVVDSCINIMLQGNSIDILKLDEFDRRFAVFDIKGEELVGDDAYWAPRWAALQQGLPAAVYAWLLDYDTGSFNPHGLAPLTAAKQEMVETTRSGREQWVLELKQNPTETLVIGDTEVDGVVATAKELEFVYQGGETPLWEITKREAEAMGRALKLARLPTANEGNKIKANGASLRYFIVRPNEVNEKVAWKDAVEKRKFWKTMKGAKM